MVASNNEERIAAWNGPLFEQFERYRMHLGALGAHGRLAIERHGPVKGDRCIDMGCGFGESTALLASCVGPKGHVTGQDAASRFVDVARQATRDNAVDFRVGDAQSMELGGPYDLVFSQFGCMFFGDPVAGWRNVFGATRSGGRLLLVVWRAPGANPFFAVGRDVARELGAADPEPGAPGPFAMADADATSDVLATAGFERMALERVDITTTLAATMDAAVEAMLHLGPVGSFLREDPGRAGLEPRARQSLGDKLAAFDGPGGVRLPSSSWHITARRLC